MMEIYFSNPLQKFKIGIYLRFVPFNSVISMPIDINIYVTMFIMIWVQQIQHWPLNRHFETYVMAIA